MVADLKNLNINSGMYPGLVSSNECICAVNVVHPYT